ncbi:MAG: hypothetical protein U0L85_07730 [Bacilli bacterium]|nr:hypothetical protein [Bacilli bacterium]
MINNELLKKTQPILYRILEKSFKNKTIPHAFLLVGYNSYDAAHFIARALICDNHLLSCGTCIDCQKIEKHSYGDFIFISGKNESIKKNQIESIQTQFSKSAIEGKNRIYMIEEIENATTEAMNSLLKTLEEPSAGIYAILTCKNINKVLPTIQSRCQVIQLLPDSKLSLRQQLIDNDVYEEDANLMIQLFHSYQECEPYIDSEKFRDLKEEVSHFIEDIYFHRENLLINVQTHLLKKYKEKDVIRLFLNMLVLGMKDLFHVKHSMNIIYRSLKDLFEKINDTDENIIRIIELILETEYLLNTNANVMLLIDSMIYRI